MIDLDQELSNSATGSVSDLDELNIQLAQAIEARDTTAIKDALANGADPAGEVEKVIGAASEEGFENYPVSMFMRQAGADLPEVLEITSLLVDAGLDLAGEFLHGLGYQDSALMKILIEAGANVNEPGGLGLTPLHVVQCEGGVQMLLQGGADLSAVDIYGRTALHTNSRIDAVRGLIEAGADLNAKDAFGMTPMQTHTDGDCRRALRAAGANLFDTDSIAELCPTNVRVDLGLDASLKMMLVIAPERTAKLVNIRDDMAPSPDGCGYDNYNGYSSEPIYDGFNVMIPSDEGKRDKYFEYLRSEEGQCVLRRASMCHAGENTGTYANFPECESVMKFMANPEPWENIGLRAQDHILSHAFSLEKTPILNRELAANGLPLHEQLGEACLRGEGLMIIHQVQDLVDLGADLKQLSADSVVKLASRSSLKSFVDLMDHGMSAVAINEHGETPLHVVSSVRKAEILLERGADPLAKNALGQCPHEAVMELTGVGNIEPVADYLRAASEAAELKRSTQAAAGAWCPSSQQADAFAERMTSQAQVNSQEAPQQQRVRMRL